MTATPTIRLPLELHLDPNTSIPLGNRIAIIDDAQPEIAMDIRARFDEPQARATLGFLSAVLSEDASIVNNEGIQFQTTLTLDINDPNTVTGTTGRATVTELTSPAELANTFDANLSGTMDIDGLIVRPAFAGATIPGQVDIFTTTVAGGATRGAASFANLSELGSLFDKVVFNNTIGSFSALTPESVVSMLVQLGNSVQNIAGTLDVPEGLPFVDEAISRVVNFAQTTQDFARQLYFTPKLTGPNNISVTNGRLTRDATLMLRIEGGEPLFITIPAASTATNSTIDDLYGDINAAILAQGYGDQLVAERQKPMGSDLITAMANVSAQPVPSFVEPLPNGFRRFEVIFAPSVNLFHLGLGVGDVIEYRNVAGAMQRAMIDEMGLSTLKLRFPAAGQLLPRYRFTSRGFLFGTENTQRLSIRTTSSTAGISLESSTVQITASDDLPTQLSEDLTLQLVINGGAPVSVTIPASSTSANGQPRDMIASINSAFDETLLGGSRLSQKLRAFLNGTQLRIVSIDSETENA